MSDRINFAKAIVAHYHYDKDEVVRIYFDECQTKTKNSDPEIAYLLSSFWMDRNTEDVCKGMNIQTFLDYCEAKDPMVQLSDNYLLACRVSVLLRGMGNAFGLKLRMSELWYAEATKFLKDNNVDYTPPKVIAESKKSLVQKNVSLAAGQEIANNQTQLHLNK